MCGMAHVRQEVQTDGRMTAIRSIPRDPIRVGIVEDHDELRLSWVRILNRSDSCCCVAACATGEEAIKTLPAAQPEVVLMDIRLPGMSGIECTARLKQSMPKVEILILTVYDDEDSIFEALKAGASGYLLKRAGPAEILRAIEEVHAGGAPMTSEIARKVVRSFRQSGLVSEEAKLTPREEEILSLLAQGFMAKEIAARLQISYFTVQTHLKKIYEKLHVHSRTEAVIRYLK